jgi:hypothetical protein
MSKKVSITPRPSTRQADAWVNAEIATATAPAAPTAAQADDMKRLTIDIPASLHRRVKAACASDGLKMADVVRELLVSKYGNP